MKHIFQTWAAVAALLCAPVVAQNTNEDAPQATHSLEFSSGTTIEVSYRQLRLSGGQSLKALLSKSPQGKATRSFYNENYLPQFLHGTFKVTASTKLGDKNVKKGTYGFLFRIDDELKWHLVLTKSGKDAHVIALESTSDKKAQSKRLVVEPVAADDTEAKGHLEIRYGPLVANLDFAPSKATEAKKKD